MSDERIRLVRNDTRPQVELTITNDDNGQPANLTNSVVTLHMRAAGSTVKLFSRQAFIPPETAPNGRAIVIWFPGDLDLSAGVYEAEIEIVFEDESRQTVFDLLTFVVREDIGEATP
jgi:hypothetical protein